MLSIQTVSSRLLLLLPGMLLFPGQLTAQRVTLDHWETLVYADSLWRYTLPTASTPANWRSLTFVDNSWSLGPGGFGYGDGDDGTVVAPTLSVFMRQTFVLPDSMEPYIGLLHADYDDGFAAFLNGVPIGRSNLEKVYPVYNDTATDLQEAQIYQGGNPSVYYLDPDFLTAHLRDSLNVLAVQVHNRNLGSSDLTGRFYLSFGMLDTTIFVGGTHPYFYTGSLSSNLPIVQVNTLGQTLQNDVRITAQMKVIDYGAILRNQLYDLPNNYEGWISIEKRGSSSLSLFPKVNYGFETQDSQGENLDVALMGLPEENDWTLHGPYSDKSLMRNVLMYSLGRKMGHYAPRTRFCELYLDREYRGVYVLVEKIKRDVNRLDIARLAPTDTVGDELTGGYILKIDRETPPGGGWYSAYAPQMFYAYHHPSADNLHPLQKNYIRNWIGAWENRMRQADFADPNTGYRQEIDVPSFVDFFLANELAQNVDAYRLSSFLYKEKDSKGGKLYQGPLWDFNLGFGNADYCLGGSTTGWALDYCGSHPFWWKKLVGDPYFRNARNCRWQELRAGPLHLDSIYSEIDAMVSLLDESQQRNFERWNVLGTYIWPNEFVGQSYLEEVDYLKTWIAARLVWMDGQMTACTPVSLEPSLRSSVQLSPNPAQERLRLTLATPGPAASWQLYDLAGREIFAVRVPPGQHSWEFGLPRDRIGSGLYTWRCHTGERIIGQGKLLLP